MQAGIFNLVDENAIEQGSDFNFSFIYKNPAGTPINVALANFSGVIKQDWNSNTLATFTITKNNPPTDGVVKIALSAAGSASIPVGIYKYDIRMVLGGVTTHIIKGNCQILETVTR